MREGALWAGGCQRPLCQDAPAGTEAAKVTHREFGHDEAGGRERGQGRADPEGDVRIEARVGGVGPKLFDPCEVGLPGRFTTRNECGQVSVSHIQRLQVIHETTMQLFERRCRGHPKRGSRPSTGDARRPQFQRSGLLEDGAYLAGGLCEMVGPNELLDEREVRQVGLIEPKPSRGSEECRVQLGQRLLQGRW